MADRGLCEHLVRVALIECVELPGLTIAKKLKIRTRVKSKKNTSLSISSDSDECDEQIHDDPITSPKFDKQTHDDPITSPKIDELIHDDPIESINKQPQVKKSRGRPPKISKALQESPKKAITGQRKSTRLVKK